MVKEEDYVLNTLSADAFWSVNKAVARKYGIENATFISELIYKYKYWKAKGQLDNNKGFFYTSADIQKALGCSERVAKRLTKSVQDTKLVEVKKRGTPAKNYWYIKFKPLLAVLTGQVETVLTTEVDNDPTGQVETVPAITKKTDEENKPKKENAAKAPPPLMRRLTDLIGEAHKHLTGADLVWQGKGKQYGQAMKDILKIVEPLADDEARYQEVRGKCAAFCIAAAKDEFYRKQGVTPSSILSNWNKLHYKKTGSHSDFGAKVEPFPRYHNMTRAELETAFHDWSAKWDIVTLKKNISPDSFSRYVNEHGQWAPAIVDVLERENQERNQKQIA